MIYLHLRSPLLDTHVLDHWKPLFEIPDYVLWSDPSNWVIIGSCDPSDVSDPSNLGISNNLSESSDLRNTSDPSDLSYSSSLRNPSDLNDSIMF